jgi:hypothetical protein
VVNIILRRERRTKASDNENAVDDDTNRVPVMSYLRMSVLCPKTGFLNIGRDRHPIYPVLLYLVHHVGATECHALHQEY